MDTEHWVAGGWQQVDYGRLNGVELWIFRHGVDRQRMVYIVRRFVESAFRVFTELNQVMASINYQTTYRDCELEPDDFVRGIDGNFTIPYTMRSEEEQRNPPPEELLPERRCQVKNGSDS